MELFSSLSIEFICKDGEMPVLWLGHPHSCSVGILVQKRMPSSNSFESEARSKMSVRFPFNSPFIHKLSLLWRTLRSNPFLHFCCCFLVCCHSITLLQRDTNTMSLPGDDVLNSDKLLWLGKYCGMLCEGLSQSRTVSIFLAWDLLHISAPTPLSNY